MDSISSIDSTDNSVPVSSTRLDQLLKIDLSTYSSSLLNVFYFLIILSLIFTGFALKDEEILTAESGLGYALGIIGGSLMLLLIIYPIRKKLKTARFMGSVRFWFKTHMLFGVAGPLAILYHSNFSTGSLNSTIALFCMIIVASSGFIGRYFYSKIHYGLYGKKASLVDLLKNIENEKGKLLVIYNITPELKDELTQFQSALQTNLSLFESIKRFIIYGAKIRYKSLTLPFKLKPAVLNHAKKSHWTPLHTKRYLKMQNLYVKHYLRTTLKVFELSIYERLFALWHTFHLPLFFMMIITGIIHVIAVHMY